MNPQPSDYKSDAQPIVLHQQVRVLIPTFQPLQVKLYLRRGWESNPRYTN